MIEGLVGAGPNGGSTVLVWRRLRSLIACGPSSLVFAAIASVAATMNGPTAAAQTVVADRDQPPAFYRLRLGSFLITALSDGTLTLPVEKLLIGPKPGEVQAALAKQDLALPLETSGNVFLVDTGDKRILVDSGAGDAFKPELGRLPLNLAASGYRPEDIDAVLITHLHPDHAGGLVHDGKPVFPNAVVYISKADHAVLYDTAIPQAAGTQARAFIAPYKAAGRLKTFAPDAQIFPGIKAVPTPGHSPGHTSYFIESSGQRLLAWGDIVHVAAVQLPDPAVVIQFDFDQTRAREQRERILADAAKQGYWVAGAHISFPGLGHIHSNQGRFDWVPASYRLKP